MKTLRAMLLAAAAASALGVGQAQAGLITITNVQMPYQEITTLYNIDPAAPQSVYTGQTVFTTASPTSTIYAWCMDLFHDIGLGGGQNLPYNQVPFVTGTSDNATPTSHPLNAGQVSKMTGLFALGGDILQGTAADLTAANSHYGTSGSLDDWSAGVQLAVWDTEYSPTYGALSWSGGSAQTAQIYNELIVDDSINASNGFELFGLQGQQSFGGPDASPVGEPAGLALLAVGLIGLGVARYRRCGSLGAAIA